MYESVHTYEYNIGADILPCIHTSNNNITLLYALTDMYSVYMHACMYNVCLPKMRLQMAFLAILMFWNDPRMWILLY